MRRRVHSSAPLKHYAIRVSFQLVGPNGELTKVDDSWFFYCNSLVEQTLLYGELKEGMLSMQVNHVPGAVIPYGRSNFEKKKR